MNQEQTTQHNSPTEDAYAIFQLKQTLFTHDLLFEPFSNLQQNGIRIDAQNYNLVYSETLSPDHPPDKDDTLEELFIKFNLSHPEDYHGRSMSVSDVVALKINNEVTFHYVDSFGFEEVPNFLEQKTHSTPTKTPTKKHSYEMER